jgi:RHS repeat-associated protein
MHNARFGGLWVTWRLRRRLRLALIIFSFFAGTPGWAAAPEAGSEVLDWGALSIGFEELLVPTAVTSIEEDAALSRAIGSYREHAAVDDFRALEAFLADHPQSGWRVAVLTNLGLAYYHYGYFSKTIDAFEEAWREGRDATEPKASALVDRAVGELLRMHARLGHSDQLAALLGEVGERGLTGPATEAETGAKEGLWAMRNNPGVAYLCGPMALKNLLLAQGTPREKLAFLDAYRSSPEGVTLSEVARLADQAGLPYRLVRRDPGEPVPIPSIVHWKVSHFAAIVGESEGRFQIEDPTFGQGSLWVTRGAVDSEASGYFLVPGETQNSAWRDVGTDEAGRIRGMGYTTDNLPSATTPQDDKAKPDHCGGGMCDYNFTEMVVSLNLNDRPVGYAPPIGPPVYTRLTYNHREASQPANFNYFNVSPKWTLNWLSYIQESPSALCNGVSRYVAGGGSICYSYDTKAKAFAREARDASLLVQTSANPIVYQRQLADGGTEVYAQSDGASPGTRRVFLSQIIDPTGNPLTLNYNRLRLMSITDATGRSTTFSYDWPGQPLLVHTITDPFGRFATLEYDSMGRLYKITDVLNVTTQFFYEDIPPGPNMPPSHSFINQMTTPYGPTVFSASDKPDMCSTPPSGCHRYLFATDPLGHSDHLQFYQGFDGPSDTYVPEGLNSPFNNFLYDRNTFYWDKHAYAVVNENVPGSYAAYIKSRIKHWTHLASNTNLTADTVESVKYPLESRIWFNYSGQQNIPQGGFPPIPAGAVSGTLDKPSIIARVLDSNLHTQKIRLQYNNDLGHVTSIVDPLSRQTTFGYDPGNQIDLLTVSQGSDTIASFTYNSQHRPLTYTDAAGQTTQYMYNAAGQVTQITDPLKHTTTYNYDPSSHFLTSIVNGRNDANGVVQASFTPDAYSRVRTRTDSEGYTVTYDYDAMDRLVQETYPDGTTRIYTWDEPGRPLDLHTITDRQGKMTTYDHDAVRNLIAVTDPLGHQTGHQTKFDYYENGKLKSLTDPNGYVTTWCIDVQSRVTEKHYPDGQPFACDIQNWYHQPTPANTYQYMYENSNTALGGSRLTAVIDPPPLGQVNPRAQVKQYTYADDDRVTGIDYMTLNTTPSVRFFYDDPSYPRMTAMNDGSGKTTYHYWPVGSLGALQLMNETEPDSRIISYQYDALGRVASRTVDGNSETFFYDAIGRLVSHNNDLGEFSMSYLGQTRQITSLNTGISIAVGNVGRILPIGFVGTDWTYDSNLKDRRLKSITNAGNARSYGYTIEPENRITGITETVLGRATQNWSYHYDDADRLKSATSFSQWGYMYDPADNLTTISRRSFFTNQTTVVTPNSRNQIDNVNGFSFSYDANGNLIEDDLHKYIWDADNRLIEIDYKNNTAARTSFSYDGFGRRITITERRPNTIPAEVTDRYLWCGEVLCQAKRLNNVFIRNPIVRRYFMEGETHPVERRAFYYARDHLGSVRDLLDPSTGQRLQPYDYDPYGVNITQFLLPQYSSDFRYAGMFYHQPSGLYLTRYRAYDPRFGRWLSRDPLGDVSGGIKGPPRSRYGNNLYAYALNNPINNTDPLGLAPDWPQIAAQFARGLADLYAIWVLQDPQHITKLPRPDPVPVIAPESSDPRFPPPPGGAPPPPTGPTPTGPNGTGAQCDSGGGNGGDPYIDQILNDIVNLLKGSAPGVGLPPIPTKCLENFTPFHPSCEDPAASGA